MTTAALRLPCPETHGATRGVAVSCPAMPLNSPVQPLTYPSRLDLTAERGGRPPPALFVDFDGTLVDIAPHPDAISVAPGLPQLLEDISRRLNGRLAIVSGRQVADLDRHLGTVDITMAGSHGGELRKAGSAEIIPLADPIDKRVVAALRDLAREQGGLLVETKPCSAAIHYRSNPAVETEILAQARCLADANALKLKRGKMVVELAMPGADKGHAVSRIMELPGFAGAKPCFIGDDVTDEDAFRQVREYGGMGILVGAVRQTQALYRLPGVQDVHEWLETLLQ